MLRVWPALMELVNVMAWLVHPSALGAKMEF
jgi:hypothetical protein